MFTLNNAFPLRDKGVSNSLSVATLPRHRWYFVKEAFSPRLVEQAVATDHVKPGDMLLDPFSGSGTVPVSGAALGLQVLAHEINPFLRFLTSAKLRSTSASAFKADSRKLLKSLESAKASPLEGYSTFSEGNRWNRWLFPTAILRTFESGWQHLQEYRGAERDLLLLALLGAAMDCCNATRDGKCLRYPKGWASRQAGASRFRQCFETRAAMIASDLQSAPLTGAQYIVQEGDTRKLLCVPSRKKFRLCVTSPPYLNSFDYSDIYRPELFLGRFVDSTRSLMDVRLSTVRSHLQAKWAAPLNDDFGVIYSECIDKLGQQEELLWDRKIPIMVQAYFEDMHGVLARLRERAAENASAWLVVSTSAYAGVDVPVDLILADIAQRTGWYLREVGVLRYLRSSSQHVKHVQDGAKKGVPLRESVVILDASKRSARSTRNMRRR